MKVGDNLFIVFAGYRNSDKPIGVWWPVVKVGRAWITVQDPASKWLQALRFDKVTLRPDEASNRYSAWVRQEDWAAHVELGSLWSDFTALVRDPRRPAHITADQLRTLISIMQAPT